VFGHGFARPAARPVRRWRRHGAAWGVWVSWVSQGAWKGCAEGCVEPMACMLRVPCRGPVSGHGRCVPARAVVCRRVSAGCGMCF
jgi:hypothetical protein